MIAATKDQNGNIQIFDGNMRLRSQIETFGSAKILLDGKEVLVTTDDSGKLIESTTKD